MVPRQLSASDLDERMPVGSVVSLGQARRTLRVLDKTEPRVNRELSGMLEAEPNVRLIGRDLWGARWFATGWLAVARCRPRTVSAWRTCRCAAAGSDGSPGPEALALHVPL